jgi:hypothetical protein
MDRTDLSVTSVSNKSRNFRGRVQDYTQAELGTLREQARADVNELFDKYAGGLYIRRRGHPLFGRRLQVDEVILVYESERGLVDRELAEIVMSAARDQAAQRSRSIAFHVTFQ